MENMNKINEVAENVTENLEEVTQVTETVQNFATKDELSSLSKDLFRFKKNVKTTAKAIGLAAGAGFLAYGIKTLIDRRRQKKSEEAEAAKKVTEEAPKEETKQVEAPKTDDVEVVVEQ